MKFIKLTMAYNEKPIWLSIDKIMVVCGEGAWTRIYIIGNDEYLLVTETVDDVVSKCEAQR